MEKRMITPEEAERLIIEGDMIHTFSNPAGFLIGTEIKRDILIKKLQDNPDKIEIGGETCRELGHGIVFHDNGFLFIETDRKKLQEFDPI